MLWIEAFPRRPHGNQQKSDGRSACGDRGRRRAAARHRRPGRAASAGSARARRAIAAQRARAPGGHRARARCPGARASLGGGRHRRGHRLARRHPAGAQMSASLLESAQNLLAGLLDLGRTRFELFGTELREELARLAATVLGGLAGLGLPALRPPFGPASFVASLAVGAVALVGSRQLFAMTTRLLSLYMLFRR